MFEDADVCMSIVTESVQPCIVVCENVILCGWVII